MDTARLSDTEKQWLNTYHQQVWQDISPYFTNKGVVNADNEKILTCLNRQLAESINTDDVNFMIKMNLILQTTHIPFHLYTI
ncbi:M24 family metallopeptidase C-terminal domain-containing protein [Vibrio sp. PP-XX7]